MSGGIWVDDIPGVTLDDQGASDAVLGHLNTTMEYASDAWSATTDQIATLNEMLQSLSVPDTDLSGVDAPYVPDMDYSSRPQLGNVTIPNSWPTAPISPTFKDVPEIGTITVPTLSVSAPSWNNPEKPTLSTIAEPGDTPTLTMPNVPTAPSITLPDAPTLGEIVLPSAPTISIPSFAGERPDINLTTPDGFTWEESPFNSPVWDDLLTKVRDGVINGGTGLGATAEAELFARGRRRLQDEGDELIQQIRDTFSEVSYAMPPGVIATAEQEAYQAIARKTLDLNSDITVKQAELAYQYSQFITDKGFTLEQILRDFHNAQMNRSFEGAKEIAASGLAILESASSIIRLKLERYNADAAVFAEEVKAQLVEVEIFKGLVESAKVSSDVQRNLVSIYEGQINALETTAKLYTAQTEGAKVAAEVEMLKVEAAKLETEIYTAKNEAQKLKVDIYTAEVEAEKSKAQTYAEQLRGYLAELEAKKIEVGFLLDNRESTLKENAALVDRYRGDLTAFSSEIEKVAQQVNAVVEGFRVEVSGYSAETEAAGMMYGAKIKEIEARIEESRFYLEQARIQIESGTAGYLGVKELQTKGIEGIMNVLAQLSSAAMNATNTSASISAGFSQSYGKSYSHGLSLSESHTYEEE